MPNGDVWRYPSEEGQPEPLNYDECKSPGLGTREVDVDDIETLVTALGLNRDTADEGVTSGHFWIACEIGDEGGFSWVRPGWALIVMDNPYLGKKNLRFFTNPNATARRRMSPFKDAVEGSDLIKNGSLAKGVKSLRFWEDDPDIMPDTTPPRVVINA